MSSIKRRFVLSASLVPRQAAVRSGALASSQEAEAALAQLVAEVNELGGQGTRAQHKQLLATFPQGSQALAWVLRNKEAWAAHAHWQLKAAIAVGDVVEWGGDCFGEAVNVAEKTLEAAQPHEYLIADEVFSALPWEAQVWFRNYPPILLAGRQQPVLLHVLADSADVSVPVQSTQTLTQHPTGACGLRLEFLAHEMVFGLDQLPVSFGRSSKCSVIVENARSSRIHARIDLTRAGLELTDLSSNGTFVAFDGSPHVIALRRGFCVLQGNGTISVGGPPDNRRASTFRFSVLMSSQLSTQTTL